MKYVKQSAAGRDLIVRDQPETKWAATIRGANYLLFGPEIPELIAELRAAHEKLTPVPDDNAANPLPSEEQTDE